MFRPRYAYNSPVTHRYRAQNTGCPVFSSLDCLTTEMIANHDECLASVAKMRNKFDIYTSLLENRKLNTSTIKGLQKVTSSSLDNRLKACLQFLLIKVNENADSKVSSNLSSTSSSRYPNDTKKNTTSEIIISNQTSSDELKRLGHDIGQIKKGKYSIKDDDHRHDHRASIRSSCSSPPEQVSSTQEADCCSSISVEPASGSQQSQTTTTEDLTRMIIFRPCTSYDLQLGPRKFLPNHSDQVSRIESMMSSSQHETMHTMQAPLIDFSSRSTNYREPKQQVDMEMDEGEEEADDGDSDSGGSSTSCSEYNSSNYDANNNQCNDVMMDSLSSSDCSESRSCSPSSSNDSSSATITITTNSQQSSMSIAGKVVNWTPEGAISIGTTTTNSTLSTIISSPAGSILSSQQSPSAISQLSSSPELIGKKGSNQIGDRQTHNELCYLRRPKLRLTSKKIRRIESRPVKGTGSRRLLSNKRDLLLLNQRESSCTGEMLTYNHDDDDDDDDAGQSSIKWQKSHYASMSSSTSNPQSSLSTMKTTMTTTTNSLHLFREPARFVNTLVGKPSTGIWSHELSKLTMTPTQQQQQVPPLTRAITDNVESSGLFVPTPTTTTTTTTTPMHQLLQKQQQPTTTTTLNDNRISRLPAASEKLAAGSTQPRTTQLPARVNLLSCSVCGIKERSVELSSLYGTVSCPICANFFTSFLEKPIVLYCRQDGDCLMTFDSRCKACWIKRCFQKFSQTTKLATQRAYDSSSKLVCLKYSLRLLSDPEVSLINMEEKFFKSQEAQK